MTTLSTDIVLDSLCALENASVRFTRYAAQLDRAYGFGRCESALVALQGLDRALTELHDLYCGLKRQVVAIDGGVMGERVGSFGELALRARTLLLAAQLVEIGHAIDAADPRYSLLGIGSARSLFTGRLRCFEDVTGYVCEQLARINRTWLPYRADRVLSASERLATSSEMRAIITEREDRYNKEIRNAQLALCAIGDDPDFAAFLRTGTSRLDWRLVQAACTHMLLILQITVFVEPVLSLMDPDKSGQPAIGHRPLSWSKS